jgi:hypothetical protein
MSKEPDEYGHRPFNLRGGLSLPPFKGVNIEKNPGDLDPEEFNNLINAWIKPTEIISRYGQSKTVTGPQSNEIVGLFDTKLYDGPLGSVVPIPAAGGGGSCSGPGGVASGIMFALGGGGVYTLKIHDSALGPPTQTLLTRPISGEGSIFDLININGKNFIKTRSGATGTKFERVCINIAGGVATATVSDATPVMTSSVVSNVGGGFYDTTEVFWLYKSTDGTVHTSIGGAAWAVEFTYPGSPWVILPGLSNFADFSGGTAILFLNGSTGYNRLYVRTSGGTWVSVLTGLPNNGTDITISGLIGGDPESSELVFIDAVGSTLTKWTGLLSFIAQPTWPSYAGVRFTFDRNLSQQWLGGADGLGNHKYGLATSASATVGTPTWETEQLTNLFIPYYQSKFWQIPGTNLRSWSAPFSTGSPTDITSASSSFRACIAYA